MPLEHESLVINRWRRELDDGMTFSTEYLVLPVSALIFHLGYFMHYIQ